MCIRDRPSVKVSERLSRCALVNHSTVAGFVFVEATGKVWHKGQNKKYVLVKTYIQAPETDVKI